MLHLTIGYMHVSLRDFDNLIDQPAGSSIGVIVLAAQNRQSDIVGSARKLSINAKSSSEMSIKYIALISTLSQSHYIVLSASLH